LVFAILVIPTVSSSDRRFVRLAPASRQLLHVLVRPVLLAQEPLLLVPMRPFAAYSSRTAASASACRTCLQATRFSITAFMSWRAASTGASKRMENFRFNVLAALRQPTRRNYTWLMCFRARDCQGRRIAGGTPWQLT
jgi:hypothetical protein